FVHRACRANRLPAAGNPLDLSETAAVADSRAVDAGVAQCGYRRAAVLSARALYPVSLHLLWPLRKSSHRLLWLSGPPGGVLRGGGAAGPERGLLGAMEALAKNIGRLCLFNVPGGSGADREPRRWFKRGL